MYSPIHSFINFLKTLWCLFHDQINTAQLMISLHNVKSVTVTKKQIFIHTKSTVLPFHVLTLNLVFYFYCTLLIYIFFCFTHINNIISQISLYTVFNILLFHFQTVYTVSLHNEYCFLFIHFGHILKHSSSSKSIFWTNVQGQTVAKRALPNQYSTTDQISLGSIQGKE